MRILVLGNSGSGKTTAAEIVADLINSDRPRNCSDYIIQDYAYSKTKSPMKALNLIKDIKANKNNYRQELFTYGIKRQKEDPAYPVSEAIKHANVVTGVRTKENLEASKKYFDLIIWIDRDKVKSGSTDQLGPEDADLIIDNNGTIPELLGTLKMKLIEGSI